MLTREEKARQLLYAMTEIEDRYIAEAAPENTEHSAASEGAVETATLVQMKHADVEKTKMDAQKEAEAAIQSCGDQVVASQNQADAERKAIKSVNGYFSSQ